MCTLTTTLNALCVDQKLFEASVDGQTAEARRLIAEGAPVDWQDVLGQASLHLASAKGHAETVMLLIEKKCNINITDKIGRTPLAVAAYHNKMAIVRILVKARCDITIRGKYNKTAAQQANEGKGTGPIAEYLSKLAPHRQVRSPHRARAAPCPAPPELSFLTWL